MLVGVGLYVKNSAEAVELYKEAFELELGYHVKNPDGSYFHSELNKDGEGFVSVVEGNHGQEQEHIVQLGVTLATEELVEKAFDILSAGGTVKTEIGPMPWTPCAAEIIDKFGVLWYLTAPQHRPPEDYDPSKPWDASMYKNPEVEYE